MDWLEIGITEDQAAWVERTAKARGIEPAQLLVEVLERYVGTQPRMYRVPGCQAGGLWTDERGVERMTVAVPFIYRGRRKVQVPLREIRPESEIRKPQDAGALVVDGDYALAAGWPEFYRVEQRGRPSCFD